MKKLEIKSIGANSVMEIPINTTFYFYIENKEFSVKISPDKKGILIREVSGESLVILPSAENSIKIQ